MDVEPTEDQATIRTAVAEPAGKFDDLDHLGSHVLGLPRSY